MQHVAQLSAFTDFENFRAADLDAAMEMYDMDPRKVYDRNVLEGNGKSTFVTLDVTRENAMNICKRSVLVKYMYELWGKGKDVRDAIANMNTKNGRRVQAYFQSKKTWCLFIGAHGSKLSMKEQTIVRETVRADFPFSGNVSLKNSDVELYIICEYGPRVKTKHTDSSSSSRSSIGCSSSKHASVETSESSTGGVDVLDFLRNRGGHGGGNEVRLQQVYICRKISQGQRGLLTRYSLKTRPFLGPTSTPAELALLMANQARVRPGSLAVDTFAGTGSILVALAHFGATCYGTDIDIRILRGGNTTKTLATNFKHYGLELPELIRGDASTRGSSMLRSDALFDAVVCDPPYGIRAGARKSGSRYEEIKTVSENRRATHIAQTQPYDVDDILDDLLDNSARMLRIGGHLVFLMPAAFGMTREELPKHPCLRLKEMCEQRMSDLFSRWMICYVKVEKYEECRKVEYLAALAACRTKRPSYSRLYERMEAIKSERIGLASSPSLSDEMLRAKRLSIESSKMYISMCPPKYSAFNDEGIPTADLEGNALSKSEHRRLRRGMKKHIRQRAIFLQKQRESSSACLSASSGNTKRKLVASADSAPGDAPGASRKWRKIAQITRERRRFENRNVVILGGTSPIGRATVLRFVVEGATITVLDSDELRGRQVVSDANSLVVVDRRKKSRVREGTSTTTDARMVSHTTTDVTSPDAITAAVRRAAQWTSDPSVFVLDSTVLLRMLSEEKDVASAWTRYETLVRKCGDLLRSGRGGGSIVLIAPPVHFLCRSSDEDYKSTAMATVGFDFDRFSETTRRLADELGRLRCSEKLRVNAVRPGVIFSGGNVPSMEMTLRSRITFSRAGSAIEVSGAVSFLASRDASYVHGVVLPVDGGLDDKKTSEDKHIQ